MRPATAGTSISSAILKKKMRKEMKDQLALLRPEDSLFLRERLHENLQFYLRSRPGVWASYRPFGFEVCPPIEDTPGIEWVHPRLEEGRLSFYRGHVFEDGPHGIQQPVPSSQAVRVEDLTGVLVPGLAFDRAGHRLGRGKGYYDRSLKGLRICKVGLAHACQILEEVPSDSWDVGMDAVITDQTVILPEGES